MARELGLRVEGAGEERGDGAAGLLAEAFFHPAQRVEGDRLVNDTALAVEAVSAGWGEGASRRWALVLLDLQFTAGKFKGGAPDPTRPASWPRSPDPEFGLMILAEMARLWPDPNHPGRTEIPVVAHSVRPRHELEARLNRLGCLAYLQREGPDGTPVEHESLRRQFADYLFRFGLLEAAEVTGADRGGRLVVHGGGTPIIGRSLVLLKALRRARAASCNERNCLLLGPTGSGKELFARYIHEMSPRSDGPFVTVNCSGFPDSLIESELFGYARRSGISNAEPAGKPGAFEQADGGTLFLDEIGEMARE